MSHHAVVLINTSIQAASFLPIGVLTYSESSFYTISNDFIVIIILMSYWQNWRNNNKERRGLQLTQHPVTSCVPAMKEFINYKDPSLSRIHFKMSEGSILQRGLYIAVCNILLGNVNVCKINVCKCIFWYLYLISVDQCMLVISFWAREVNH